VAQYFTETLLVNTTDLATLQKAFDGLTPATDVSSPAAIQAFFESGGGGAGGDLHAHYGCGRSGGHRWQRHLRRHRSLPVLR